MSAVQQAELRISLIRAFQQAINEVGLDALKRTSLFGSNDPAFRLAVLEKAA